MQQKRKRRTKAQMQEASLVTEGLGDKLEKVFQYTGVKALVKAVAGEDCGCDERKENLNDLGRKIKEKLAFTFTSRVSALTLEEYEYLESVISTNPIRLNDKEIKRFAEIYDRVFRKKVNIGCQDCIRAMYGNLKQLVKIYNQ